MINTKEHLQLIYAVITTLEAAQRQCKDDSVNGLIFAAMYSAETLQSMLSEAEWLGMVDPRIEAYPSGESEELPPLNSACLCGDPAEYCFPV